MIDLAFLDGSRILTPSANQTVRTWNLETGDSEQVFAGPQRRDIEPIEISPDGIHVISSPKLQFFRELLIWTIDGSQPAFSAPRITDHSRADAKISPDGSCLAVLYVDGTVHLMEVETGREVARATGFLETGHRVEWSRDGTRLAATQTDGTVLVLAPSSLPRERGDRLSGHDDLVLQAVWSPDGSRLATVSYDNTVKIWDWTTRQPTTVPLSHPEEPVAAEFSPDSALLYSQTHSHDHRLWNTATGELLLELDSGIVPGRSGALHPSTLYYTDSYSNLRHFSPGGDRLLLRFVGGEVRVIDTKSLDSVSSLNTGSELYMAEIRSSGFTHPDHSARKAQPGIWDADSGTRPLRSRR